MQVLFNLTWLQLDFKANQIFNELSSWQIEWSILLFDLTQLVARSKNI